MKYKFQYLLLSLGLIFISPYFHVPNELEDNTIVNEDCYTENTCFQQGEKIVYKVFYNWNFVWLAAGEVVFEVAEAENEYRISGIGRTYPSYEWFFKVRDYYYTFIDKETFLPHTFIRDVQEGSYTLYDKIKFDQDNLQGSSLRGKSKEEAKLKPFALESCMHDMLSIIYKMRNIDFDEIGPNSSIPVKIFLDMETYSLNIKTEGKEAKKWVKGQGSFNTIKLSPELIAGNVFDEGQSMDIWISDDENKIPLIIESPVSVGSLKVILKEYSGLKFPLTSKL